MDAEQRRVPLEATSVKLVVPGMRRLMYIASALVLLAGAQLFVFSERTDEYFAWTIDVHLTAAFLGAGYCASVLFEFLAAREPVWAYARIAIPSVFVFTTLTLIATFMHLDLFHLGSDFALGTQIVTWAWIAIYVSVPIVMITLLVTQARAPGTDPPRETPLPRWMRTILAMHVAVFLGGGILMFLSPSTASTIWPWELTELTARAVGAWVISIGVASTHAFIENDLRRVRLASVSYLGLGLLQLVAVARFAGHVQWGEPAALIYLAVLVTILLVGAPAAWQVRARTRSGRG